MAELAAKLTADFVENEMDNEDNEDDNLDDGLLGKLWFGCHCSDNVPGKYALSPQKIAKWMARKLLVEQAVSVCKFGSSDSLDTHCNLCYHSVNLLCNDSGMEFC